MPWPDFFVVGTVAGVRRWRARVAANGSFEAALVDPPAGAWSFQLVAVADRDEVEVGHPGTRRSGPATCGNGTPRSIRRPSCRSATSR
ncbi:MAG: hypothetical protein U1E23_19730 [Reyranellaceae bacterium]